jgi:signal peptidase
MTRRIARVIGTVAVVVSLAGAAALAGLLIGVPAASGGAALTVWSGSMEPAIPRGSIVVVRPVNPLRLEPGDVITYQVRPDEPTFVTHRVVEVQADAEPPSVITKGDANPSVDSNPIEMRWIQGRVLVHVPFVGYVSERARGLAGMPLALLALGGAAIVGFGGNIVREVRKQRAVENASELSDVEESENHQLPATPELAPAEAAGSLSAPSPQRGDSLAGLEDLFERLASRVPEARGLAGLPVVLLAFGPTKTFAIGGDVIRELRTDPDLDNLVSTGVGADPASLPLAPSQPAKFPAKFASDADAVFNFCRDIADATAQYACAFKPQIAHFAALRAEGQL